MNKIHLLFFVGYCIRIRSQKSTQEETTLVFNHLFCWVTKKYVVRGSACFHTMTEGKTEDKIQIYITKRVYYMNKKGQKRGRKKAGKGCKFVLFADQQLLEWGQQHGKALRGSCRLVWFSVEAPPSQGTSQGVFSRVNGLFLTGSDLSDRVISLFLSLKTFFNRFV